MTDFQAEWLETDGRGGFASGTVGLTRTRRYHALLLTARTPPTDRLVLVNGIEAWVQTEHQSHALTSHLYAPDVVYPDGGQRIVSFTNDPWPTWTFALDDGTRITHEIMVSSSHDNPVTVLRWRLADRKRNAVLSVRPMLSGRDYHALHLENGAFRFDADVNGDTVVWRPYDGLPAVCARSNGRYAHSPEWFRQFLYATERDRGLDCIEDLASPGVFGWDLSKGDAILMLSANTPAPEMGWPAAEKKRRARFASRLHRAADDYIVRRGTGKTIVAGYPWFTDWGRDTFIALRGLCLATGRLDDARDILVEWAGAVDAGMLPNRFPDQGERAEFNSVDASLWYVIAAHEYQEAAGRVDERMRDAIEAILAGYAVGARYGIRLDHDGLIAAGEPGAQLTWMDAKVGDWVVTPRAGKPVEIQALWLNALRIGSAWNKRWREIDEAGTASFKERFWNEDRGCLFDVIDPHDALFRPNQIFAVGGLPFPLLDGDRARRMVDAVEQQLWTPVGLRSLAPGEPGYTARYQGGVRERDGAYHQGTVWPWLIGPFVEAWVRVRGNTSAAKSEARTRFVAPLLRHLDEAGLGHISEIADAETPHTPRGCPWQAWSVGEALRLTERVLADIRG